MKPLSRLLLSLIYLLGCLSAGIMAKDRELNLEELTAEPVTLEEAPGQEGEFTWWLPAGADQYILPISGGIAVETSRADLVTWLQDGSPWNLAELPLFGARYENQLVTVVIPWPHYAELVVGDRLGVRFSFPEGRHGATPCTLVAARRNFDLLEPARVFREWRKSAKDTGGIPRARTLERKAEAVPRVSRLSGAPHIYLWGPALFSLHDVPQKNWKAFARALRDSRAGTVGHRLVSRWEESERRALEELSQGQWASRHLRVTIAAAIDHLLSDRGLLGLPSETSLTETIERNKEALEQDFDKFLNPREGWGDGLSTTLLSELRGAGIERALLLLSDLYERTPRPEVVARAEDFGYLLGPYDSYHSIHSPDADPEVTWETAQFDRLAYEQGRVLNADGSGHRGFRGKGYHFSPRAAWPYVQGRVAGIRRFTPYTVWFVDCDATAESFDDYSEDHPSTRVGDIEARRRRLQWLDRNFRMVVGSEGGSVLFTDLIHFGHGVHTPYIGHLDPAFRDRSSPHFLGRYWPPDTPEQSFKPVPLPKALRTPYFDPTVRIPLYRAALGDEIITTHHWSFDSLKFSDIQPTRELLEILYMVPPLYHLNRETWPERRQEILRHLAFWGPLHRALASTPPAAFALLSEDLLLQRTTFRHPAGEVTITVNFSRKPLRVYPPLSATVSGALDVAVPLYRAIEETESFHREP